MYKIKIIKGFFKNCTGVLEGYYYNQAVIKIEVENHNEKDVLTLLMKTSDYEKIKD